MKFKSLCAITAACTVAPLVALPIVAEAAIVANPTPSPQCGANTAFFNPTLPPNIVLPTGFTASVFAAGLNAPTGIAFRGTRAISRYTCWNRGTVCRASATISHCGQVESFPRIIRSPPISWYSTGMEERSEVLWASPPPMAAVYSPRDRPLTSGSFEASPGGSSLPPTPTNRPTSTMGTTTAHVSSR